MKKLLIVCSLLFVFVGCSTPKTETPEVEESITILAPKGAAALSLLDYYATVENPQITFVDGTDVLTAELASATSGYDVIVAPINVGAKIAEAGNHEYQLLGVVTWGNLYLVQNDNLVDSDLPMVLFGEGAVPQKIITTTVDVTSYEKEVIYLPSVSEVQSYLLSDKASYGLLAEPALTATLSKAAEVNASLSVVLNLQEAWFTITGYDNYPQAAIFVRTSSYQANQTKFDSLFASLEQINSYVEKPELIEQNLAGHEEEFGVANAKVITIAWDGMNIEFISGKDVIDEITYFLDLFNISVNSDLFLE